MRDPLTGLIIEKAVEIHRELGPGLLESTYEECLCYELRLAEIDYTRQISLPIYYKGVEIDCGYRLDLIVRSEVIVELKAVKEILPVHDAQLLTYLKISGLKKGLILNFNVPVLRDGIKRMVL